MMDFIPEAQTLLMVVAGVPRVKPEDTIRNIFYLRKYESPDQPSSYGFVCHSGTGEMYGTILFHSYRLCDKNSCQCF